MSMNVKRGLVLLAVAVIALFLGLALSSAANEPDASAFVLGVRNFVGLTFVLGLIGGGGLIAWGLLRD